ncbi:MAG: Nramp family divalent metal transporter [Bacteroidales bacterium]|nr:Nramp family divalent metal transporter [Bacteroidales bacterium]MCF8454905.1 Nramp family divalent metal transporter [Bacteroidales bacterium]
MKHLSKLSALGPGLVWAAAAIGVSHLVQSTRAGSMYGFELIWIVLLINLFKYPFFEFAPRYAASTGESLLDGYQRLGKWALYLFLILTIGTMFAIQSAVTLVTAGLFANIFEGSFDAVTWAMILLGTSAIIVIVGRYSALDRIIKFIIVTLTLTTVVAVVFSFSKGFNPNPDLAKSFNWEFTDIAFLIAFAGWMPTAIDISVWHSFWILAKKKESGRNFSMKNSLFDFNVGYFGTAILALGFLSLGALVMYGTGEEFSPKGTEFAGQLISLYTKSIGPWAYILISIAAITTMFSTTLTCLDAYPRVLKPLTEMIVPKVKSTKDTNWLSYLWLFVVAVGAYLTIRYFASSMKFMVDLATTLSFITAPILGWMNFKVVRGSNVPEYARPKKWLVILSWVGLVVLSAFSVYFLVWRFFV